MILDNIEFDHETSIAYVLDKKQYDYLYWYKSWENSKV